jgi:hypothetical protein
MRRKKIESYKENTETLKQEKLQQEKEMQSKLEEKRKEEERKRIEKINKENEVKRREAEKVIILLRFFTIDDYIQEDIQRKLRLEKIKKFQSNPMVQQIIKERGEELFETMDVDEVLKEQVRCSLYIISL